MAGLGSPGRDTAGQDTAGRDAAGLLFLTELYPVQLDDLAAVLAVSPARASSRPPRRARIARAGTARAQAPRRSPAPERPAGHFGPIRNQ